MNSRLSRQRHTICPILDHRHEIMPKMQLNKHHISIISIFMCVGMAMCLILTNVEVSNANSRQCISLERKLASTGKKTSSPSKKYLQYKRAVGQQAAQISKTKIALRKNRCQNGSRSNLCKRIKSSLSKMQNNLSSLQRKTRSLAPRTSNSRENRAKILRAMKRQGCGAKKPNKIKRVAKKSQKPRRRTILEQLFGVKTYSNDGSTFSGDGEVLPTSKYGTYRSLCVRTCDGYYFPISFSTTKDRLGDDQETCENMCPGTETTLFYHEMPTQDAEQSISLRTGQAYASLKNAFAYRKEVNPQCTCKASTRQNFKEVAGSEKQIEETLKYISLPIRRKDPMLDPDTLLNRVGKLTPEKLGNIAGGGEKIAAQENQKIRIVGPAFFPVQ